MNLSQKENALWYFMLLLVVITNVSGFIQVISYYQYSNSSEMVLADNILNDLPKMVQFLEGGMPLFYQYLKRPLYSFWLHIIPSFVWGIAVLVQFSPYIRKQRIYIHRLSGYIMATLSITMMIGVWGIVTSRMIYTLHIFHWSVFTTISFAFVGGSWFLITLLFGLICIFKKDVPRHRIWMMRHAMAGLAVGMQRLLVGAISGTFQNLTHFLNRVCFQGNRVLWTEDDLSSEVGKKVFFAYTLWLGFLITILVGENFVFTLHKLKKN
jgi:hypothetical protein